MVLESLNITQWRTVMAERWETNKVSPMIIPSYCVKRGSRPQHRVWNLGGTQQTLWLKEIKLSLGKPRQLEFAGHSTRKERTLEIFTGFPTSIHGSADQCLHVRKLREAGKELAQRIRGSSTWCSHRLVKFMGHFFSPWDIWVEFSEGSFSLVGNN